jgi:broad specificity phosphatase PhoE
MARSRLAPACFVLCVVASPAIAFGQRTGHAADSTAQPTTVIVVRHAERADDGSTRDPDLSETGHARARALADALADAGVGAILVTQFRRTRQTAEPLAARVGVPIDVVEATSSDVAAHVAAVRAAIRAHHAEGVVLVVGHSITVPALVRELSGRAVPDMPDSEYGTLYLVTLPPPGRITGGGARVVRARF